MCLSGWLTTVDSRETERVSYSMTIPSVWTMLESQSQAWKTMWKISACVCVWGWGGVCVCVRMCAQEKVRTDKRQTGGHNEIFNISLFTVQETCLFVLSDLLIITIVLAFCSWGHIWLPVAFWEWPIFFLLDQWSHVHTYKPPMCAALLLSYNNKLANSASVHPFEMYISLWIYTDQIRKGWLNAVFTSTHQTLSKEEVWMCRSSGCSFSVAHTWNELQFVRVYMTMCV